MGTLFGMFCVLALHTVVFVEAQETLKVVKPDEERWKFCDKCKAKKDGSECYDDNDETGKYMCIKPADYCKKCTSDQYCANEPWSYRIKCWKKPESMVFCEKCLAKKNGDECRTIDDKVVCVNPTTWCKSCKADEVCRDSDMIMKCMKKTKGTKALGEKCKVREECKGNDPDCDCAPRGGPCECVDVIGGPLGIKETGGESAIQL